MILFWNTRNWTHDKITEWPNNIEYYRNVCGFCQKTLTKYIHILCVNALSPRRLHRAGSPVRAQLCPRWLLRSQSAAGAQQGAALTGEGASALISGKINNVVPASRGAPDTVGRDSEDSGTGSAINLKDSNLGDCDSRTAVTKW